MGALGCFWQATSRRVVSDFEYFNWKHNSVVAATHAFIIIAMTCGDMMTMYHAQMHHITSYCTCVSVPAELPAGRAGTANAGATTFLTAVNISSLTGITLCPSSHYCPGGSPVAAGVPQACPAGITVNDPPGISRSGCNREYPRCGVDNLAQRVSFM